MCDVPQTLQDPPALICDGYTLTDIGPGAHRLSFQLEQAILDVHLGTTEGTITFGGAFPDHTKVQAHTFSFVPAGLVQHMETIRSGPSLLLAFQLDALHVRPARNQIGALTAPIWNMADPAMIGAALIAQEFMRTPDHQVRPAETAFLRDLLTIRLLQIISRSQTEILPSHTSRPVQRALEYIDTHLSDKISLESIATVAGMSPFHFARIFRTALGTSVRRYVIFRRIERAQHLIANTDLSLAEIAYSVGFSSQSHMTTLFTKFVGRTPNSFRDASASDTSPT